MRVCQKEWKIDKQSLKTQTLRGTQRQRINNLKKQKQALRGRQRQRKTKTRGTNKKRKGKSQIAVRGQIENIIERVR